MTTDREMIKAYRAGWVIDGSGGPAEKNMLMTVAGGEILSLGHAAIPVQGGDVYWILQTARSCPG